MLVLHEWPAPEVQAISCIEAGPDFKLNANLNVRVTKVVLTGTT